LWIQRRSRSKAKQKKVQRPKARRNTRITNETETGIEKKKGGYRKMRSSEKKKYFAGINSIQKGVILAKECTRL